MIEYESILLFVIPWIIYRLVVFMIKRNFSVKIEVIKALFYFAIVFIYCLTLFPYPFYVYPHERADAFQLMNLTPFASIYGSLTHFYFMVPLRNIGGNILLFMPLGFSIPLRFNIHKLWKVMLLGFFLSVIVEVIQLFTSIRSFDVDDLILNTFGTMVGFFLYHISTKVKNLTTLKR